MARKQQFANTADTIWQLNRAVLSINRAQLHTHTRHRKEIIYKREPNLFSSRVSRKQFRLENLVFDGLLPTCVCVCVCIHVVFRFLLQTISDTHRPHQRFYIYRRAYRVAFLVCFSRCPSLGFWRARHEIQIETEKEGGVHCNSRVRSLMNLLGKSARNVMSPSSMQMSLVQSLFLCFSTFSVGFPLSFSTYKVITISITHIRLLCMCVWMGKQTNKLTMKHRPLLVDTPSSYFPLFTTIFIILFRVCVVKSHAFGGRERLREKRGEMSSPVARVFNPDDGRATAGLTASTRINQLHQKVELGRELNNKIRERGGEGGEKVVSSFWVE